MRSDAYIVLGHYKLMTVAPQSQMTEAKVVVPRLYWISAYFFSIALLYLWGYWSAFDINILEYVGLSDVVMTAAYPIASAFLAYAIGACLGEFIFPEGFLPPGGGANTKVGRVLHKIWPAIPITYMGLVVLFYIFGSIEKWRTLPILLALPVAMFLNRSSLLRGEPGLERARLTIFLLFAALPLFAYGNGVLKAHDVLSGKAYLYVTSKIKGHVIDARSEVKKRLRYLGKAGDQYFLYAPSQESVLILSVAEAKFLELKRFESK